MAITILRGGKRYSLVPGMDRGTSLNMGDESSAIFPNVEFEVADNAEEINLVGKTVCVNFMTEYDTEYPVFSYGDDHVVMRFDKTTHKISECDDEMLKVLCNHEALGEFLTRCIFEINKFVYVVYTSEFSFRSYYGWGMNFMLAKNTIKLINDGTISQVEALIKNLGKEFFMNNIAKEDFVLNNAKKLHRVVELPKQVIEFLKDKEFSSMLSTFRLIAADDPNEAIALVDCYNRHKKLQNLKKGLQEYNAFVGLVLEAKKKNPKITLHRLIPYLTAQRVYFHWPVEDKLEIPYDEARLYRDYINLGATELYPACLQAAHNILVRNSSITKDETLCNKFAQVVAPWKDYEWTNDGYSIIAPTKAQDFVDEGEALHHCLATYVELVANGSEKVMFLREETNPNTSLVTFAFDDNFNIVESKTAFNMDVEEPKIIKVLNDWKKKMREKFHK